MMGPDLNKILKSGYKILYLSMLAEWALKIKRKKHIVSQEIKENKTTATHQEIKENKTQPLISS